MRISTNRTNHRYISGLFEIAICDLWRNCAGGILVSGRVQGVGFRRFARNSGERLGVEVNPINLRDGRVFVIAEGKPEAVKLFINELRKGPTFAHVEDVDVTYREAFGNVYDM